MVNNDRVAGHYERGDIMDTIRQALVEAGKNLDALTPADIAPIDHLHGRGLAATRDFADRLDVPPGSRVLDIGCGVGGPARYFADRFDCHVSGVDLTPAYIAAATSLSELVGMGQRTDFQVASATDLPFEDESFDAAYSQNVTMNIPDKAMFFHEAFRVLRPGGFLALAELNQGPGGEPLFPTPWATSAETSFLVTTEETERLMKEAGFLLEAVRDLSEQQREWLASQRDRAKSQGRPALGTHLVFGPDRYKDLGRNAARNIDEARILPVDFLCRKP